MSSNFAYPTKLEIIRNAEEYIDYEGDGKSCESFYLRLCLPSNE